MLISRKENHVTEHAAGARTPPQGRGTGTLCPNKRRKPRAHLPRPGPAPAALALGPRTQPAQLSEWAAAARQAGSGAVRGGRARARTADVPAPPGAQGRRARDNGTSATNTPGYSIRGCLLPTLARPGDRAREAHSWERQPHRRSVPCVSRAPGPACALWTPWAAGPRREDGRWSRDICGRGPVAGWKRRGVASAGPGVDNAPGNALSAQRVALGSQTRKRGPDLERLPGAGSMPPRACCHGTVES